MHWVSRSHHNNLPQGLLRVSASGAVQAILVIPSSTSFRAVIPTLLTRERIRGYAAAMSRRFGVTLGRPYYLAFFFSL